MSLSGKNVSALSKNRSASGDRLSTLRSMFANVIAPGHQRNLVATFFTTLTVFGIFLIQGIIVAIMLGPTGRGEFGTSLYFPRDILLYTGLLGAVEIVAGYAARGHQDLGQLRFSAFRLGAITGIITALLAALISVVVLFAIGKAYIIPFCFLVCLFLPFEHVQLTVSAVDRGNHQFSRYNFNRLVFALVFPIAVLVAWQFQVAQLSGMSDLVLVCLLFVLSRIVGLIPTLMGWDFFKYLKASFKKRYLHDSSTEIPDGELIRVGQMLKEGKPYALSMLVSETFDRLDVFLILALASVTTSGHYFVAVPAAALLVVVPNSLSLFTFNFGANRKILPSMKQLWLATLSTCLFQFVATVAMIMVIPWLIVTVFGEDYRETIPFALWLLPACAIKGLIQAADAYLKGREKPMIGVWSRGLSIVVMLAFVGLMFGNYGLISIPMSACVGQAISLFVILFAVFADVRKRNLETGFMAARGKQRGQ